MTAPPKRTTSRRQRYGSSDGSLVAGESGSRRRTSIFLAACPLPRLSFVMQTKGGFGNGPGESSTLTTTARARSRLARVATGKRRMQMAKFLFVYRGGDEHAEYYDEDEYSAIFPKYEVTGSKIDKETETTDALVTLGKKSSDIQKAVK